MTEKNLFGSIPFCPINGIFLNESFFVKLKVLPTQVERVNFYFS